MVVVGELVHCEEEYIISHGCLPTVEYFSPLGWLRNHIYISIFLSEFGNNGCCNLHDL